MKRLRRPMAFLMVFVLLFTFVPYASATGTAADETPNQQDIPATEPELMVLADSGIMTVSDANCNSTLLATFWVNTPEVNPSGVEDYFLYYEFPAGAAKHRNNIGLHAVQVDGVWKAAYCIEPGIAEAPAYYKDEVTIEQMLSHSGKTSTLTDEQFQAIGVVMLYGQVAMPEDGMYDALCRMLAAQIIVWEIALGWRQPYAPFTCTNDTFIRRYANGDKGVEVSSYFLTIPAGQRVTAIQSEYNDISAKLAKHYAVPSFTSPRESQAPTIQLQPDGNGKYTATVTDTNCILDDFTFANTDELTFSKSGNTLAITANSSVSETLVAPTKNIPSLDKQVYYLWCSGSYQNMVACVSEPTYDPVPAFFKVTVPTGDLTIRKTTEDGKNVQGWQFGIYSEVSCTNLISGPHTSGSDGTVQVSGLPSSTVWVKEIGHSNATTNTLYKCDSNNPQKVTIVSGQTASVSFYNKLNTGNVKLIKTTNTGKNLDGWKIGLYYDSACKKPVSGSPFTTASDGTVTISGLVPGTYYAKENASSDPYWISDTAVKTVTVQSNKTAEVSFENTHYGDLRIRKTAVNGSAKGWNFQILDKNKKLLYTVKTDSDGYVTSPKLLPGTYYVREVHDRDDTYWTYDATVEKKITVTAGAQAQVSYTNTQYGRMEFYKTTNTGKDLAGWVFRVTDAEGNHIGDYTTDSNGYVCTGKLSPGRYYVTELSNDDPYWVCDLTSHTVDVTAGKTTSSSWSNTNRGKGVFQKQTNTGKNLEGWYITVYSDAACKKEITTVATGKDGSVSCYLEPGTYYAKETGDKNGRYSDSNWSVDPSVKKFSITAHKDTAVTFTNTHYGRIKVIKALDTDGSLGGWLFKVTNANGKEIVGSPFTTQSDGTIITGPILPGKYTVEEMVPDESLFYCKSQNPQTVTVSAGKTASVKFTNALRPGRISIQKVDAYGQPLADAKFILEWSDNGTNWKPVTASKNADVVKGCSANQGTQVTPASGYIEWANLSPGIYYRITELEAPEGYNLLTVVAFEGKLPVDDLSVDLRVVNTHTFTLPKTGSHAPILLPLSVALCLAACVGAIYVLRKKEN